MPLYDSLPGSLSLSMRAGDDFSATVDFSISLTAHTMTSTIHSVVTGGEVGTFAVTVPDAAAGKVNISLSDTQTAALSPGTYTWRMVGVQGGLTKTYLQGHAEVVR
jgi:hypothetical protein